MANARLKCKQCGYYQLRELVTVTPFGKFCSKEHAIEYSVQKFKKDSARKLAKIERDKKKLAADKNRRVKARLKELRPAKTDKSKAQAQVNRYCRLRDRLAGITICCCCDRLLEWNKPNMVDGGHFQAVGSKSSLRFNTWNIHAQTVYCNRHNNGNSGQYESRLRQKIGSDKVDLLINEPSQAIKKMSKQYLQRIERVFKKRADRLQKRLNKV